MTVAGLCHADGQEEESAKLLLNPIGFDIDN